MKVIYVAGPFRRASTHMPGQQDSWGIQQNVMRAMELALEVWRSGAAAVCPHANTAPFEGSLPAETWLDGDIEVLSRCDGVIMTPDWESSAGARAEHDFARHHCIPIFYDVKALREWLWVQQHEYRSA